MTFLIKFGTREMRVQLIALSLSMLQEMIRNSVLGVKVLENNGKSGKQLFLISTLMFKK